MRSPTASVKYFALQSLGARGQPFPAPRCLTPVGPPTPRARLLPSLRAALRALRATPLVSAVAILSLALGIGANTAIFSIVDALILRELPVAHAPRLAVVRAGETRSHWTNPIWESVRRRPELFDGALARSEERR